MKKDPDDLVGDYCGDNECFASMFCWHCLCYGLNLIVLLVLNSFFDKIRGLKSIPSQFLASLLSLTVVCLITEGSLVLRHAAVKYATFEYFAPLSLRYRRKPVD